MSERVSPTERIRAQIDELFGSERDLTEVLEEVGRLGVRLLVQSTFEAEVDAFLGRGRYERRSGESAAGSRNGWQPPATIKTTMGPIEVQRPKLGDTDERFCSRLFGKEVTRTNALETLVISGWVRGLSDRDIEAALAEVLGPEAALSRSTVSRICQRVRTEFAEWQNRDLSDVELDYLFLDGSHFKMHPGAPAEPVLCAWGIDRDGKPVFVGLGAATCESTDAWDDFLTDLKERGLRPPLLGISDGAGGLISAFELHFPHSLRQRCVIHRLRNALAKVSKANHDEFKADWWAIFNDIDADPGEEAIAEATQRADRLVAKWADRYPSAVKCLTDDFASLVTHLRFPAEHRKRLRHSNFIERTFGETRRRVKVIGRMPGETNCLSLLWAVLDRASRGWRGVGHTPATLRLLANLRHQLFHPSPIEEVNTEAATPAA